MRCLIIDDESLATCRLVRLMSEVAPRIECLVAKNGQDALKKAKEKQPDLVLLDIRMPGMDGLEVASRLQKSSVPPAIIFCTAYETHALEAIKYQAAAYLLKPVNRDDLLHAIDRGRIANRMQIAALNKIESNREFVSSVTHRGVETMAIDLVRCFLAEEKYVLACGENRELLISESLKHLEVKFKDRLLRVHRNALVAIDYLQGLYHSDQEWLVSLDGTNKKPLVSRRHLKNVRRIFLARR